MRSILVVGLGKSGVAAAKLLSKEAAVTAWDGKAEENFDKELLDSLRNQGVKLLFGGEPKASSYDEVVMSPGVPCDLPWLEGANLTGEMEVAYEHCKGVFWGITGTNGKTTVTSLLGEMVKADNKPCKVVGNIGNPVAEEAPSATEDTIMVTELSSFQLETIHEFHPHVACILNITPDHLNRHGTFENYARIKGRVTENQTAEDYFIYNLEDDSCIEIAEKSKAIDTPFSAERTLPFGAFVKKGKIVVKDENSEHALCKVDELIIPGHHNLENALAAVAMAYFGGISVEAISKTLKSFKGVEHRIEFVRELRGVRYINDSKGTNPDASIKAVEATNTPILLIAGGYEKNSDFTEFIESFDGKVKALLLLGATAERFKAQALECGYPSAQIYMCSGMRDCIQKASLLAAKGDTVLLSPASASWDMYTSYEKRGEDFKNLVNELK